MVGSEPHSWAGLQAEPFLCAMGLQWVSAEHQVQVEKNPKFPAFLANI